MATLTALYTRIILDIDRDDMGSGGSLEQAKIDAVADAIAQYKMEQFWFNRASGSGNTSADDATLAMPSGVFYPNVVSYDGEALVRVPLHEIEHRTETGIPEYWAENEDTIQLWPIPDGVYAITVNGLADIDAPASGGDSNIWTTEAYNLILNAAKRILAEGPLHWPERVGSFLAAEERALKALRRESMHRRAAKLRSDLPPGRMIFDINRGW